MNRIPLDLSPSAEEASRLHAVAEGSDPADLALRGGRLADVHALEWVRADVMITGGYIAAIAPQGTLAAAREVDVTGHDILPGFVDSQADIGHSLVPKGELARLVVPLGTTSVLAEPDRSAALLRRVGIDPSIGTRAPLRILPRPARSGAPELVTDLDRPDAEDPRAWEGDPNQLDGATSRSTLLGSQPDVEGLVGQSSLHRRLCAQIERGASPLAAVRNATLTSARRLGLDDVVGSVAPGRAADLVIVSDPRSFFPRAVYVAGHRVAEDGRALFANPDAPYPVTEGAMHVGRDLTAEDLAIAVSGPGPHRVRVLELLDGIEHAATEELRVGTGGTLSPDPVSDVAKIAIVDRHSATGRVGRAFVRGFGLRAGAIAVSTNRDDLNIVVVTTADLEGAAAVNALVKMGGGFVVSLGGRILGSVPLRLGGVVSDEPFEVVLEHLAHAKAAALRLGCALPSPFVALSSVARTDLPELALTDLGLVDVATGQIADVLVT